MADASIAEKCPRCWLRTLEVPEVGLCWPCNTFLMEREDDSGVQRDWRIGRRVAVKYRDDPRHGTHGRIASAELVTITVRADDGSLIHDDEDKWRTA